MTAQDIIDRFPNEDATAIADVFPIIENTIACYYGGSFDNDCDREPMLLLAMHLIRVETSQNSDLREVASRSVDGVSVSFSTSQNGDGAFFSSTRYGQMFQTLIKNRGVGAVFV